MVERLAAAAGYQWATASLFNFYIAHRCVGVQFEYKESTERSRSESLSASSFVAFRSELVSTSLRGI
ncbi:hypothetical protein P8452_35023 [Trifolium repens]|nr:hypothetical protein P8452_35023 [Trifolium repens]